MNWLILLVDDDPLILKSIRGALRPLEQTGTQIWSCHSAIEAIQILEESPIDLIISDENMGEMKGTELLSWVSGHSPETRRIILTGDHSLSPLIDSHSPAGIDAYLTKPFKNQDVLSIVVWLMTN